MTPGPGPGPGQNNLLTPGYIPQGKAIKTGNIELFQAETVSNNSLKNHSGNQSPQSKDLFLFGKVEMFLGTGRIARRKNKVSKERGSPSWSVGRYERS